MARKPRIHDKGALYHVIARGNNKDSVFKQYENKKQYLRGFSSTSNNMAAACMRM